MSGFVKSQRERFKHPLFKGEKFCRGYAWDWMVANAAFKDHEINVKGKMVLIKRGQLCHSVRHMAEVFGWSKSAFHRFLTRLETETMIGTESGTGQLVITICNYGKYQDKGGETGTGDGTGDGTAAGQQRDNKEEGEEREEKITPSDDLSEAVLIYNAFCEKTGWPRVVKLTPSRRGSLKARLSEFGLDGWQASLERASTAPHLTGQNDRGWMLTFDWITNPTNFCKVIEGAYDRRQTHSRQSDDQMERWAKMAGKAE